jgi:TetR/AcrR family transcriptional regulator, transcriptional repressor for nem operon
MIYFCIPIVQYFFIMKDTRDFIIDEAYKLFLSHSYEAVSISMISEAIGFTKGALYHHFKNKEELFHAVIDKHFPLTSIVVDVEKVTFDEYLDATLSNTQKILKAIFSKEERFIPVNYLSLIADTFRHYQGYFENTSNMIEDDIKKLEYILTRAIRRGEIRKDINVSVVARQVFSLNISIAGNFILNSSIDSAMKSLKNQLRQLYDLLKP